MKPDLLSSRSVARFSNEVMKMYENVPLTLLIAMLIEVFLFVMIAYFMMKYHEGRFHNNQ